MALNERQRRFCHEFMKDLSAQEAAKRAGYAEDTAYSSGSRLLDHVEIAAYIEELKEDRAIACSVTAERIVRRFEEIAFADPHELMELRRGPCGQCWDTERSEMYSGVGFDVKQDACPECSVCHGEGIMRTFFQDTRKLKGNSRKLFAGIKATDKSIELKTHDQLKALEWLGNYMSLHKQSVVLTGPDGGPVALHVTADEMSDEQLASIAAGAVSLP